MEEKSIKKLKKRARSRFDGRWTIVALFFLTVMASLFFYLKTEIPLLWQKISSPLLISNFSEETKFDPAPVLTKIEALTKDRGGTYGIFVYRLREGNQYGLHQDEIFPAASLIKLPVILTLYQQAEKGEINLESKYALSEGDKVGGAGILQAKAAKTIFTYRQLAQYMGQYSDNTASRILRKILGEEVIEETIKSLGMAKTSLKKNETTPKEVGLLFQKLYQGDLVSPEHRDEILDLLTETAFEEWIPAAVPEGVRVAHKIGIEVGSFADAGIVFAEKPFVLVIMSKGARQSEAKELLPRIAKAIWEFENQNGCPLLLFNMH